MDVLQMWAVVATVESRSFTKAGELLFSSPQTIKNHIDALEFELGVRLFVRSQKGVVPTGEGRYLYEESKRIIGAIEKMTSDVKALGIGEGISLACPHESNQPLRDRICADFAAAHPEIRLRYVIYKDEEGMLECMRTGKTNAAFWSQLKDGESLDGFVLHPCPSLPTTRYYAVVLESDELARLSHVTPQMLVGRSVVRASRYIPLPKELASRHDEQRVLDDLYEIVNHCLDGGVCLDCNYMPVAYKGLVRIPIDLAPLTISVMTKESPSDAVMAFVQHCVTWTLPDGDGLASPGLSSTLLDTLP